MWQVMKNFNFDANIIEVIKALYEKFSKITYREISSTPKLEFAKEASSV